MNKRHWIILAVTLLLLVALLLPACAQPSPAPATPSPTPTPAPAPAATTPAAQPILLKFAYDIPPTSPAGIAYEWWADEVESRTGGRVMVDTYPGGSLVKNPENVDGLRDRVDDIGMIALVAYSKNFPISNVFNMPNMNFPDTKEGHLASQAAAKKLINDFADLKEELSQFKLLFWFPLPASMIISSKPIHSPADMKGLKVGCMAQNTQIVESAGGAPVFSVPPDMYMNLDKGVVDAGIVAWNHMFAHKLYEVAPYVTEVYFGQEQTTAQMNWDSWNALSPDIQQIITQVTDEANVLAVEQVLKLADEGKQLTIDAHRTIIEPTPDEDAQWAKVAQSVTDGWLAEMKGLGVTDAQNIMDELNQLRAPAWK